MKYSSSFIIATTLSTQGEGSYIVSIWKRSQVHRLMNHPRSIHMGLFGLPNPDTDVNFNLKTVSNTHEKKTAGKLRKEAKILRPHAPLSPRPSPDEAVLKYANQLLETQAASKSPTHRISDEEPYQVPPTNTHYLQTLTKDISVGPKPRITSMELLRDSKRRAEKLLSRSIFEKEKAEEKKARIRAKMEEELRQVENTLMVKLETVFLGIEKDVENMQILLNREIILEEERMAQFNVLVQNLQSSALVVQKDMATETKIYQEMKSLQTKLESDSDSAKHLEVLIARKQELLDVEADLLNDLKACVCDTKQAFIDCEKRYKSMHAVLDTICRPVQTDWSNIDSLEIILEEAARNVEQTEAKLMGLREKIASVMIQKDNIFYESVDVRLDRNSGSILKFSDLKDKDDTDLLKELALSLGNATYNGSKATALAIKSLLNAVSTKEVRNTANLDEVRPNHTSNGSNQTFKENARTALDSIVDDTKIVLEKAVLSDASKEAGAGFQNVSNDLMSAANVASMLGGRAYRKFWNLE